MPTKFTKNLKAEFYGRVGGLIKYFIAKLIDLEICDIASWTSFLSSSTDGAITFKNQPYSRPYEGLGPKICRQRWSDDNLVLYIYLLYLYS